jgi:hypothetical protein
VVQAQLWGIAMRCLRLPSSRPWTFVQIAPKEYQSPAKLLCENG